MKRILCILLLCSIMGCSSGIEYKSMGTVVSENLSGSYSVVDDSVFMGEAKVGDVLVDPDNPNNVAIVWDEVPQGIIPIDIPPMKQDGSYDCWATCGAMIVNYRLDLGLYPVDFVYASYGITEGTGDRSGSWELFKTGMNSYDLSVSQCGPMTFSQVEAQIDRGDPIMFVGQTPRGNYHDVLIVHANTTQQGQEMYSYNDPWTGKCITTMASLSSPDRFYMAGEWVTWVSTRWGFYKMH